MGKSRIPLALWFFLFGVFTLTASGHTYSPDEETILYVAQAMVTRGEFDIPNRNTAPVVGGQRGLEGKIYAATGALSSAMVAPFYATGDAIGRAVEPRMSEFVLRVWVVTLFNSILGALCGVVLYAWLRRLGVGARSAVAAALVAMLATFFWVYTRTLYAETLLALWWLVAAYAVRAFHDTRKLGWLALAGLAVGLATLTKLQGALILPALVLYFGLMEYPRWRRGDVMSPFRGRVIHGRYDTASTIAAQIFAFGAPLVGMLILWAAYNVARFGAPFELGYGEVDQAYPLWRGIYGQLLSSGKSVFLYAPPLILCVLALPRSFRAHLAEAALCVTLIATVIVFHGRVYYWAGDGAWGPRYLVATLPFWVVPLAIAASAWWAVTWKRAAIVSLTALGVLVNLLGMSVNFDTYIQIEPREVVRHFEPPASPLPAQWNLLRERVETWRDASASGAAAYLTRGFTNAEEMFPQYIPQRAEVWVKNTSGLPAVAHIYALDYRVENRPKRTLEFRVDGAPVPAERVPRADAGELEYNVLLPAGTATLEIVTVGSDERGKGPYGDELGVQVQTVTVTPGESELPLYAELAVPPAPAGDARELWGWFFRPTYPHFDHLVWYVAHAGFLSSAPGCIVALWALVSGACAVGGGVWLWRALR